MQGAYISDVNWVIYLGAYIWGDIWSILQGFTVIYLHFVFSDSDFCQ